MPCFETVYISISCRLDPDGAVRSHCLVGLPEAAQSKFDNSCNGISLSVKPVDDFLSFKACINNLPLFKSGALSLITAGT